MIQLAPLALVPLQMDEDLMFQITIISTIVALILAIGIGYWVYKDASKRDNNELLWTIVIAGLTFLTLILGLLALVVYLVVRGDEVEAEPTAAESAGGDW